MEIDFGSVERAVAFVDHVRKFQLVERGFERARRRFPILVAAHGIFGTRGKLDVILKTEQRIHFVDDPHDALDLFRDLFGRHEDMRVVLRKASHAHQPVKLTALFVAVNKPQLAHANGQIFITVRRIFIHEQTARTVHGLDRAVLAVDLRRIHIVFIVIPMPRIFPKRARENNGRLHFDVIFSSVNAAPIVHKLIFEDHAVGQEKGKALSFGQQREQFEFLAEFNMIALFRFFEHREILVHLLFFRERRAVDSGKHFLLFVAAPIRARDGNKLERLDLPRRRQMRSAAQIGERALFVERNFLVCGKILYQLHFIIFAELVHEGDRLVAGQCETLDRQIALDDFFHLRLDLGKIFGRDGRFEFNVVIKSVFDHGTDRQFARGIHGFERLRQNMRARMAVDFQTFFVFQRDDFKRVAFFQHGCKIAKRAVDLRRDGGARQPFRNALRRCKRACAFRNLKFVAVFEYDFHVRSSPYAEIRLIMRDIVLRERAKNKNAPSNPPFSGKLRTQNVIARFHLNCRK